MKKILIIFCLLFSIISQAKENKKPITKSKHLKSVIRKNTKKINTQQPQWGVWDAIVDIADWLTSPFRPVWGDYVEDGMRSGNPWPKLTAPCFAASSLITVKMLIPVLGNLEVTCIQDV